MGGLDHNALSEGKVYGRLGPIAGTGSYQNGEWIDRSQYGAALMTLLWQTSGGVTGGSIKFKMQDATSIAGAGVADFGAEETVAVPAGPNAGGIAQFARDLRGARQFIRIAVDSDPTGGTPASIVAASILLTRPTRKPAP